MSGIIDRGHVERWIKTGYFHICWSSGIFEMLAWLRFKAAMAFKLARLFTELDEEEELGLSHCVSPVLLSIHR